MIFEYLVVLFLHPLTVKLNLCVDLVRLNAGSLSRSQSDVVRMYPSGDQIEEKMVYRQTFAR